MIPITRKELYLNKIVGNNDYETPEKPITTEEFFFAEILGEAVQAPEPLTRYQIYLAKIAGRNIEIPYPETRLEYFLAKACGMDIETPTPITREEIFWSNYSAIADFEVEGVPPLTYKAIEGTLENYRIYGNTVNGENVGDLITEGEHAGEYSVPVTVEGKNLVPNTATSKTVNGVTFTVNSDGSVTCNTDENGATAEARFYLVGNNGRDFKKLNINANAIITGCPLGGNKDTYSIFILRKKDDMVPGYYNTWAEIGNGWILPYSETNKYVIFIKISTGTICNNLTFYPMIRLDTIDDDTYEPYHAPVTTPIYLPEQIKKVGDEAEYIDYAEQKMHRVRKNLLPNTATSQTINGVTFTVNEDGSVTCNGECEGKIAAYYIKNEFKLDDETKRYILTGCPEGGDRNSTYVLEYSNAVNSARTDSGNGVYFTPYSAADYPNAWVRIMICVGYTCDNLTFYPMIRKADISDDTYEPYIENTDLDVTLPELPTLAGTNVLSVGAAVQPSKVYIKGQKERD